MRPIHDYKIHLDADEEIFVTGNATTHPSYDTLLGIKLFDENEDYVTSLAFTGIGPGTTAFNTNPSTAAKYTNNGAARDFYIQVLAESPTPIIDYSITVRRVRSELTLTPFRLTINSFIPDNYVTHPLIPTAVFHGDDRTFAEDGSVRVTQIVEFLHDSSDDTTYLSGSGANVANNAAGLTAAYEASTSLEGIPPRLSAAAKADWSAGPPLKLQWATASVSSNQCTGSTSGVPISIHCEASGADPLVLFAPPLEWDLTIDITPLGGAISYKMTGCHRLYPSYEVWGAHRPLLTDPPVVNNPYIIALACEFHPVSFSRVIPL